MNEQEAPVQQPSVGRIVHYVSYGTPSSPASVCRAAVIAGLPEGEFDDGYPLVVDLAVLHPDGLFFTKCPHNEAYGEVEGRRIYNGGTWHWPERV